MMKILKHSNIDIIRKYKNKKRKKYINTNLLKKFFYLKLFLKIVISIVFFIISKALLKNYLNQKKIEEEKRNNYESGIKNLFNYYHSLKNISYENASLLSEYRNIILQKLSENSKKNVSSVENIYFDFYYKFGNMLVSLNKAIFYCEIIKCKKIFIWKNNNFYIRNNIYDEKYNLTIQVIESASEIINNENLTSLNFNPFYYFLGIKPDNRFSVFKDELIKNLPVVKADPNDLYIHIRSGDIFVTPILFPTMAQPPSCFYKTIINNNKFNKIYIATEDKLNPVINELIKSYKNIILSDNNLELDISRLAHGYNIVGSISSFLIGIIKLNDNLRKFWEYDIYNLMEKVYHLHHSIHNYKRNYTIYQMSPSKNYKEYMYIWKGSRKQLNILIRDKCSKEFKIIEPNN